MLAALRAVIWFSRAAGIRMSHSVSRTSALRDLLGAREAADRPVLALPRDHAVDVEPGRVADAAGRVADRDDLRALVRDQRAAIEPALPKPWTATVAPCRSIPEVAGRLDDAVDHAAGGRLVAALRPAERRSACR